MSLTDRSVRGRVTLAADLAALAMFILVGARSHEAASAATVFARTAIPIGLAWLVAAVLLGTYGRPGRPGVITTLLAAVPAGAAVRSVWVGSPTGWRLLEFVAVALVFGALFVGAGRVLVSLVFRAIERGGDARAPRTSELGPGTGRA